MSEPMMATSVMIHRMIRMCIGYCSLHTLAKLLPVTQPSLAARTWKKRPMTVANRRAQRSL